MRYYRTLPEKCARPRERTPATVVSGSAAAPEGGKSCLMYLVSVVLACLLEASSSSESGLFSKELVKLFKKKTFRVQVHKPSKYSEGFFPLSRGAEFCNARCQRYLHVVVQGGEARARTEGLFW